MPSTRLSSESTPVETPLQQPPVSARYDAHAARAKRASDLGTNSKRESNGWRTLVNYISGGQGGRGGNGLEGHGGAGGAGEGPTLHYDLKAENIVVKTFNGLDATPPDFLRIPLGNINLQSEIRVDATTGAVWWHRDQKRTNVRRMYSARVVGHNEPMTVALYHGHNAEEEWKRDLSRYSRLRHPHILQIYASASSSGIHAVVFHDDMVPYHQFVDSFQQSAILKAYIICYTAVDWSNAYNHCERNVTMQRLSWTHWIRRVQNEWSGWYGDIIELRREDVGAVRYNSRAVFGRELYLNKSISAAPWLAQANYIFSQLKIVSNHEDYTFVDLLQFSLKISGTRHDPPDGQDVAKELDYPLYEICVPTSVATSWDLPVDSDDESDYSSSYSEEEYSAEDEMESNSYLASSCVEVLTTDDESFLEEFSYENSLRRMKPPFETFRLMRRLLHRIIRLESWRNW
ncbi:hypothetical protein MSAN_01104200 [Mycena sanguinolenta]|uniref:Protein kinase domain-containing protein n=1 Tax=Mycena sanguinolenta TaxID=230812 RepID=A0A8H6YT74_9AGAR|nr:hypothetical protein MSAN_01104200 [Mycena sanguinolenta]